MGKKSEISKNAKRRERNKLVKAGIKDCTRAIRKAGQRKDHAGAEEKIAEVLPRLDRAARKGLMHKNTAARKKSRLSRQVSKMGSTTQAG